MTCLLCGTEDRDVAMALVRYPDRTFNSIPRCRDHQACRDRVEAAGGTWDIEDGALSRTRRTAA